MPVEYDHRGFNEKLRQPQKAVVMNNMFDHNIVRIEPLKKEDSEAVAALIRRNIESFEEHGSVLAATFRRLEDLYKHYDQEGRMFFVALDMSQDGLCIGAAGVGSLHGLPISEGIAEIRDLVVDEKYRGNGLGSRLLSQCLEQVSAYNYQRVYLETTPQMQPAQKLFLRTGFRPVTETSKDNDAGDTIACYFLKEDLKPDDSVTN